MVLIRKTVCPAIRLAILAIFCAGSQIQAMSLLRPLASLAFKRAGAVAISAPLFHSAIPATLYGSVSTARALHTTLYGSTSTARAYSTASTHEQDYYATLGISEKATPEEKRILLPILARKKLQAR